MSTDGCVVCGKKISLFSKYGICRTGRLCIDCNSKIEASPFPVHDLVAEDARNVVDTANRVQEIVSNIEKSDYIGHKLEYLAVFDDTSRVVYLPHKMASEVIDQGFWAFPYDDLVSAHLVRDEAPIPTNSMENALMGSYLFGTSGAIIGALAGGDKSAYGAKNEMISVNVRVRNFLYTDFIIEILSVTANRSDSAIKGRLADAAELIRRINSIAGYSDPEDHPNEPVKVEVVSSFPNDSYEDLRQLKSLLDDGIITEEDFNAKKAEILGL